MVDLIKKHEQEKQFLLTQLKANSMSKDDDIEQLRLVISTELEMKFSVEVEMLKEEIERKEDQIKILKDKLRNKSIDEKQYDLKSISPATYEGLSLEELKNKLVYVLAKNQDLEKEMRFKNKFEQNRTKAFVELETTKEQPKEEIERLQKDIKYERELLYQ